MEKNIPNFVSLLRKLDNPYYHDKDESDDEECYYSDSDDDEDEDYEYNSGEDETEIDG